MPRIDPQQLLACLTPLLAVNGGIKSSGEVIRLANLMEKYSKKLVSKCIYIQILKCTETDLLGQFMAAGGWNLVHTWLNDGVNSSNWPFVQEILEMLLLCPVDGNRLKSNHTPKIVKNLSLNLSQNVMITALSKKLVEQWLKIAHQEKQLLQQQQNGLNGTINFTNVNTDDKNLLSTEAPMIKTETELKITSPAENNNNINNSSSNTVVVNGTTEEISPKKSSENVKYKISNKESGLVLSIKRSTSPINEQETKALKSPDPKIKSENKSKSSSSSSSSSSDKDRSKKSSSSSSSSHKSSSSSKSSHRDKDRSSSHKSSSSSSKDKDRHSSSSRSSSSSKHSSSREKDKEREKRKKELAEKEQAEKDKETLNFLAPLPSAKLQRIPKRQHSENSENKSDSDPSSKSAKVDEVTEKKKPSISIEVRKGDKPKTVKTLNSQFRDHGLAEVPPPPPSRKAIKKPPTTNPVVLPLSTSSSTNSSKPVSPPPAKKLHLDKAFEPDVPERAGGVKLIKPKPMIFESTGFLDALDASAMAHKKDTKKRKRLPSGSSTSSSSQNKKDEPESPKIEVKPLKFYKDTLEEAADDEKTTNGTSSSSPTKDIENNINNNNNNNSSGNSDEKTVKEEEESKSDESSEKAKSDEPAENKDEEEEPEEKRPPGIGCGVDGPPGIISRPNVPRRKRVKRSIRWRSDEELVDVRYFELDENERVNVTKTFNEQKQDEHNRERMMMRGPKVYELSEWHKPKPIDNVPDIPYGSKSIEAAIQAERERNTLQEMFFNNRSMYDSPHEPDPEEYDSIEPQIIPLDDVTGNPDSVNNFRDVQWPAPKGEQPQYISQGGFGSLFGNLNMGANLSIPPSAVNPSINPLVGLNLGVLQSAIPQDAAALNFGMNIIQPAIPAPFMQPPPMIQNNYQSNISYQNRGSNSGNNYSSSSNYNHNNKYDNNNRNRMGGNNNGNWVRGNSGGGNFRRGVCHQYVRNGYCNKQKSGCPYIHER